MQNPHKSVHANYWNMSMSKSPDLESTFDRIRNIQLVHYRENVDRLVADTCSNYEKCVPAKENVLTENSKVSIAIAVFGLLLTLVNASMWLSGNEAVSPYDVIMCAVCFVGGIALWFYDRGYRRRKIKHNLLWMSAIQDTRAKNQELIFFLDAELNEHPQQAIKDRANAKHLEVELFRILHAAKKLADQQP